MKQMAIHIDYRNGLVKFELSPGPSSAAALLLRPRIEIAV